MVEHAGLKPFAERYAVLEVRPLRVVLTLREGSRLAGYDPLNLDNLLCRSVVEEATEGRGLPESREAYDLPCPLRCLWRSPAGWPLWAATPFQPAGLSIPDVCYWHKRQQSGRFSGTKTGNLRLNAAGGRYMEKRVPLPADACRTWEARCEGDAAEVARLLERFPVVGKRRAIGHGEVERWTVEPIESFDLVREGRLMRPIPVLAWPALFGLQVPEEAPALVGWTPPQWKPSLFLPGWWTGTAVPGGATGDDVDWYAGTLAAAGGG